MSVAPLVSVIILAYKQPDFLNAAIACVAAQTHQATQILVVDDASGAEFTARYHLPANARLILNEKNLGLAAISRNTALRTSRGMYAAFLDQDDLWERDKLAIQVAALEAQPQALTHYTHFRQIDAGGSTLAKQEAFVPLGKDPLAALIRKNSIAYSSVMVRRSALDTAGGFDEMIRGASDWDLWLRLVAAGPVLADERPLLLRRRHESQWSKSQLMMARGAQAVIAKAAGWVPERRPDLRGLVDRRHARWLREVAREQMDAGERSRSLSILTRAACLRPWDFRTYGLMIRAAFKG